jgi:fructosamine-3-kinase
VTLPAGVRADVAGELDRDIVGVDAVGGGCISPAYRLAFTDGTRVFLKIAPDGAPADMLVQEAVSLECIAATHTIRVPRVLAVSVAWLALEWLEPTRGEADAWAALGRALARMHRTSDAQYGWPSPNFIGSLPQANERTRDWPAYWRTQRLEPQLQRARDRFDGATLRAFERLLSELEARLADAAADGPSLLHGDLWSGNVHFTAEGGALIDPSCCYGHREVDLAMAALFGGFPPAFFDAYEAAWPQLSGASGRRGIYQLYYLLVHVNLFGGAYVAQTRRVLESVLSRSPA